MLRWLMRCRALTFTAPLVALALAGGCADPPAVSAPSARCVPPRPRAKGTLLFAGSGAGIAPLARILAAYRRANPSARVELAPSIGTDGAIRALRDRAIDVGLAARPLRPAERQDLSVLPLVEVPLVLATRRQTRLPRPFDLATATALLSRKDGRWPDGTSVVPLYRQRGDAVGKALARSAPGLARVFAVAHDQGRGLTCYTDQQLARRLVATPGALGVLDLGSLRLRELPLRSLSLSQGARRGPSLRISLFYRKTPTPSLARFLAFLARAEATAGLWGAGYRLVGAR